MIALNGAQYKNDHVVKMIYNSEIIHGNARNLEEVEDLGSDGRTKARPLHQGNGPTTGESTGRKMRDKCRNEPGIVGNRFLIHFYSGNLAFITAKSR
jgi:hypothetical protein